MIDPTEEQEEETPKSQSEMYQELQDETLFGHINSNEEETPDEGGV